MRCENFAQSTFYTFFHPTRGPLRRGRCKSCYVNSITRGISTYPHFWGGPSCPSTKPASHVQVTFHEQGHYWHIAPHPNMEPRPNRNRVQVKLGNYQTCRKIFKMYYQKRAIASKTCESSGSEPVPYIHVFPS